MTHHFSKFVPACFVVLWSTGFIGARYAMPWAEPFIFLAGRFLFAVAILVLLIPLLRARRLPWPSAGHAMIAGALIHGVYLGGVFWAIHRGLPAGLAALVIGLQPLVTAVLAGLVLGDRILPRHWAGLGIGLAGVIIVLSPDLGEAASGVTAPTIAATLISVVAISIGTIWQKRFVSSTDLVTGTLWQYLGGAVLVVAASLTFEEQQFTVNGASIFAMAWLVLVLSIGAVFLLMHLIREGEVSKVASLFYLVPAVTAVMAWILFGESLSPVQIAGMAVTTLGVALATAQPPTRLRASL